MNSSDVESPLSQTDVKALEALKRGPMTCANLGSELWGANRRGGNCSCPWARPAGKLLHRLERRGLVRRIRDPHYALWGLK